MKQLKVMIALLAVVFSVSSAFTPSHKFVQSYFSYVGGTNTDPASYQILSSDPLCSGTKLCAVKVNRNGQAPVKSDLQALKTESSGFTVAGTFTHGTVELKP